jgi:hypothetical protein
MKMSPADITPTQDQKTTASPGREPSSSGVKSGISASFSIGACRAGSASMMARSEAERRRA